MKLSEVLTLAEQQAQEVGLDPEHLIQILAAENFKGGKLPEKDIDVNTRLVNKETSASGLMQFIPDTWKALIRQGKLAKDADPLDPLTSLRAGAILLKENLARRGGNFYAAAADYYSGPKSGEGDRVAAGKSPLGPRAIAYQSKIGNPMTSSISVTSKDADPAAFQSMLDASVGRVNAITEELSSAVTARRGLAGEIGDAAMRAATAEGDFEQASSNVGIAKADYKRRIVDFFGINSSATDSNLLRNRVAIEKARKEQDAVKPLYDQLSSISFFENPIGWLAAQFQLPTVIQKYNNAAIAENAALGRIKDDQAAVQIQQQIDVPGAETEIRRAVSAKQSELYAKALVKSKEALMHSHEDTIRFLRDKAANEHWQFDRNFAVSKFVTDTMTMHNSDSIQKKSEKEDYELLHYVINRRRREDKLPEYTSMRDFAMQNPDPKDRADYLKYARNEGTFQDVLNVMLSSGAIAHLRETNPAANKFLGELNAAPEVRARLDSAAKDPNSRDHALYAKNPSSFSAQVFQDYVDAEDRALAGGKKKGEAPRFHADLPTTHFRQVNHAQAWNFTELNGNWVAEELKRNKEASSSPHSYVPTTQEILTMAQAKVIADPTATNIVARDLSRYWKFMAQKRWEQGQSTMRIAPPQTYSARVDGATDPLNLLGSPAEIEQWLVKTVTSRVLPFGLELQPGQTIPGMVFGSPSKPGTGAPGMQDLGVGRLIGN